MLARRFRDITADVTRLTDVRKVSSAEGIEAADDLLDLLSSGAFDTLGQENINPCRLVHFSRIVHYQKRREIGKRVIRQRQTVPGYRASCTSQTRAYASF